MSSVKFSSLISPPPNQPFFLVARCFFSFSGGNPVIPRTSMSVMRTRSPYFTSKVSFTDLPPGTVSGRASTDARANP
jgi:hypothetical protein